MRLIIVCIIIVLSYCNLSWGKESVTWMVLNWPPWMIIEGEDKGSGRFDHILKIAQDNLPQYEHVTEEMNWARFWHEIEEKKNVCYPFGLKTGNREELVYYSLPHTLVLPNAIIMKKQTAERLGNPESYSIAQLIRNPDLIGYVEKNRSFTKDVDEFLKDNQEGSNIVRVSESPESLVKMVIMGRCDYTLEYPIVASYHKSKIDASVDLVSIPIAEMVPFSFVYMNCTKNEWGRQVIADWNAVLRRIVLTDDYRHLNEIGHTDENELRLIRKYYDAFIEEYR